MPDLFLTRCFSIIHFKILFILKSSSVSLKMFFLFFANKF